MKMTNVDDTSYETLLNLLFPNVILTNEYISTYMNNLDLT
jgi:hypothetical protein